MKPQALSELHLPWIFAATKGVKLALANEETVMSVDYCFLILLLYLR